MATRIQLRRGTSTEWSSVNPILAQGEPGVETNTGFFKIGNGSANWASLPYAKNIYTKSDVGLSNVDNTTDIAKPVSTATSLAITNATTGDRARANHTGVQPSATISDFTEAVQDAVALFLAAGTGVTITHNDAGNSLTVTSTGGQALDAEAVRDAMGIAMIGAGLITITVNDAADTITFSTTATANDTNANLRARSSHTGTQAASTISGGQFGYGILPAVEIPIIALTGEFPATMPAGAKATDHFTFIAPAATVMPAWAPEGTTRVKW